jgi:hypothetical protein
MKQQIDRLENQVRHLEQQIILNEQKIRDLQQSNNKILKALGERTKPVPRNVTRVAARGVNHGYAAPDQSYGTPSPTPHKVASNGGLAPHYAQQDPPRLSLSNQYPDPFDPPRLSYSNQYPDPFVGGFNGEYTQHPQSPINPTLFARDETFSPVAKLSPMFAGPNNSQYPVQQYAGYDINLHYRSLHSSPVSVSHSPVILDSPCAKKRRSKKSPPHLVLVEEKDGDEFLELGISPLSVKNTEIDSPSDFLAVATALTNSQKMD